MRPKKLFLKTVAQTTTTTKKLEGKTTTNQLPEASQRIIHEGFLGFSSAITAVLA